MLYIPHHVQIETVNRYCNARCPMCTIKFVPDFTKDAEDPLSYKGVSRKAEFMTLETFKKIAIKFIPFIDKIGYLSLYGCGEPLLDKSLSDKIAFAKEIGFKQIGFTSNCSGLTEKTSRKLLDAGLNCIIPSIDGITKEVHETIRPRTKFDDIVSNVRRFIEIRDEGKYRCKVLVRMIRQQLNIEQWDEYNVYWKKYLSTSKGDDVLGFNVHNTGGKVEGYDEKKLPVSAKDLAAVENKVRKCNSKVTDLINYGKKSESEYINLKQNDLELSSLCPDLFTRLSIFASGDVALCSADQAEYFKLGNIINEDPIKVFNNDKFTQYRNKWLSNEVNQLDYCKDCTVAHSRFSKTYVAT